MVEIYVALIINGRREFNSVPTKLQDAVKIRLTELGLGVDGKPLTRE